MILDVMRKWNGRISRELVIKRQFYDSYRNRGVLAGKYRPGKFISRGGNIMKGGTLTNDEMCLLRVFCQTEKLLPAVDKKHISVKQTQ